MACRNFLKAEKAAKSVGMVKENYTVMHLDLASLNSVKQFVDGFRLSGRPLDVLVCNAAIYFPTAEEPSFTAEGFELSVRTNHLGHFLLAQLLLDLKKSDYLSKRLIIVGSITGSTAADFAAAETERAVVGKNWKTEISLVLCHAGKGDLGVGQSPKKILARNPTGLPIRLTLLCINQISCNRRNKRWNRSTRRSED